ncbi:hypothetical protein CLV96_0303 [Leptospira meyeri]|uniref:Uncharacterized protein n=1 Tax=Leptospira meyeri TaxID=29508 RepID=A0A4V3HIB8_LEPME|nr:hypothetical protein CLV96_0303 [Leptospira meyeri]
MYKLRYKSKHIDALVRYIEPKSSRNPKEVFPKLDASIYFKVTYPYLSDQLLINYKDILHVEINPLQNQVYFASSMHVLLPTQYGGAYFSKFIHSTDIDTINKNMRNYFILLTRLTEFIDEAFDELYSSSINLE